MKLTKYKVGLILTVFLSVLLVTASGLAVTEDGDTWIIENQGDFDVLVGNELSSIDFTGDGVPDVEPGDTIALDEATLTQDAALIIDVRNITLKPSADVTASDSVVVIAQEGPYGGGHEIDTGSGPETVTSGILIQKEGAHIEDLDFEPTGSLNETVDNAILVDIENPCACEDIRWMSFENLQIPNCAANGNFDYGIRFAGNIEEYGGRSTDYAEVDFTDVRIDGVRLDGINFAGSVGDVSGLNFNELYIGNCGLGSTDGHGLHFNNHGKVENIRLENSTGLDKEQAYKYGIEKNKDGIRINGTTVTKVSGFWVEGFEIKSNDDNGIYILGNWSASPNHEISSIDLTVKNTEISKNGDSLGDGVEGAVDGGFGILVGEVAFGDSDTPPFPDSDGSAVAEIKYSPAKLDKVTIDNAKIYDNKSGGAGFFVSKVITSSPGVEVSDSQFNEDIKGDDRNEQGFGLTVASYEGITGLEIKGSEFYDHDGGLENMTVEGLAEQNLSDGIALLAAYQDGAYDEVEDVVIENTEAGNNDTGNNDSGDIEPGYGNGLRIKGATVDGIHIAKLAKFNDNGKNGVKIFGKESVKNVSLEDLDDDQVREITANGNGNNGLLVESDSGDISGVTVTSAQFGKEGNKNGNNGVKLITNNADSNIGSSDSAGAIKFKDVSASYNKGLGLEINSAEDFLNSSNNVVINDSEFHYNHEDGASLVAAGDVMNPRVENSSFVGNNVSSAGLVIEFGNSLLGTESNGGIKGNVLSGNQEGLVVTSPDPSNPTGTISNFAVKENTTFFAGNEEEYNGNEELNMALVAGQLNSVTVQENIVVGEETEIGLWLKAENSSSSVTVQENVFRTGAKGACIGLGTAVVLDAWNADINHNEFNGYSTAVKVLEEKAISDSDTAKDTSNHINENNLVDCCTTIDASELKTKTEDTGNLYKVDATNNYWGPGATEQTIRYNLIAPDHVLIDGLLDSPVLVIEILSVSEFRTLTTDPQVNQTVELEYTLENVSETKTSGQSVQMIVKNPDDNIVMETSKENVPELDPGETYTNTHSFVPIQNGTYSVTLEVDEGALAETITINVGGEVPGPGENLEPHWGQNGETSKSGIKPVPIDGTETPHVVLKNSEGDPVTSAVSSITINVFDLSGRKLVTLDSVDNLTDLNNLQNGLYIYTVTVETDDTYESPVMKFIVRK
ncbi:T9SS type A sorting domain-containing protein [Candidatus Bipolaricaulota bacterium]|nr:T9SS type A sorting domain-containing protein [Candidatus Bipolaricaulota bacterium]